MYKSYTHRQLAAAGFQLAGMQKPYLPVPVKVSFTADQMGDNFEETLLQKKIDEAECLVLAAHNRDNAQMLFIRLPGEQDAYEFDPMMGRIHLTFEAEAFMEVMENASHRNKLLFFKCAVLKDIAEANKFLMMVDASTELSSRDYRCAWTWTQQLAKGARI